MLVLGLSIVFLQLRFLQNNFFLKISVIYLRRFTENEHQQKSNLKK